MKPFSTSIISAVMVVTISAAIPVHAQRGKPVTPLSRAVGQANRPPKPSPGAAAKPPKAPKSDIAAGIASKPSLAAKLQPLLPEGMTFDEAAAVSQEPDVDLIALDEALTQLAALDPRPARIVELKFFGGLTLEEPAEVLKISLATVKRE